MSVSYLWRCEIASQSGLCNQDQEEVSGLLLQAVDNMVERLLGKIGGLRIGTSHLLTKSPGRTGPWEGPVPACAVKSCWNGSSLYFQIFVDQLRLRILRLRDFSRVADPSFPVFLCPPGIRAKVLGPTTLPSGAQSQIFENWTQQFGLDPDFFVRELDYDMPPIVTCIVANDRQILVPTKW